MNRLATTIMLGGWLGFAAIGSGALALHATGEAPVAAVSATLADLGGAGLALPRFVGMSGLEAAILAAVLALLAASLGLALVLLHSGARHSHVNAERLAAAALVGLAGLYAAAAVSGAGVATLFGDGPNFLLALALGFAALLFDHLITVDDDAEDDPAFEAALASIVDSMAERRGDDPRVMRDSHEGAKP